MKKILMGCGILALLVLVVLGGGMYYLFHTVREHAPQAERIEEYERQMRERFGRAEDYVPPRAGIEPERLALFVDVRERLKDAGSPIAARIDVLAQEMRSGNGAPGSFFGRMRTWARGFRSGMDVLGEGLQYIGLADSMLLDAGMGRGEYLYNHLLSAQCWLGWTPTDVVAREGADPEGPFRELGEDMRTASVRLFRQQLRNAQSAFESQPPASPQESAWAAAIDGALVRLPPPGVFPLEGKLPIEVDRNLEPYRAKLRSMLPDTVGELLVESPLLMDSEDSGAEVRVKFD